MENLTKLEAAAIQPGKPNPSTPHSIQHRCFVLLDMSTDTKSFLHGFLIASIGDWKVMAATEYDENSHFYSVGKLRPPELHRAHSGPRKFRIAGITPKNEVNEWFGDLSLVANRCGEGEQ